MLGREHKATKLLKQRPLSSPMAVVKTFGGNSATLSGPKPMATALLLLAGMLLAHSVSQLSSPLTYKDMNCSRFACMVTGHRPATAAQLYQEALPITSPLRPGDIVCFHGVHVAVWTEAGLMDSIPSRGPGRVTRMDPADRWYYGGPVKVIRHQ